jgi:type II secretory pathway pseudopilin PulG
MIVVAVIAVLAVIAVPAFFKETRKAKSDSEVTAMLAEFRSREEQYKIENGVYLAAAACPSSPTTTGTATTTCMGTSAPWTTLKMNPQFSTLKCSYTVSAGLASDTATIPAGFTFTQPVTSWYTILATCDMDGSSTTNSTFFTSSVDSAIQKQNAGY